MTTLSTTALRTVDWYESSIDLNNDNAIIPQMMLGRNQDWITTCAEIKNESSPTKNPMKFKDNTNAKFINLNIVRGQARVKCMQEVWRTYEKTYIGVSSADDIISVPMWSEIELNNC